jgi:hypothetical protein
MLSGGVGESCEIDADGHRNGGVDVRSLSDQAIRAVVEDVAQHHAGGQVQDPVVRDAGGRIGPVLGDAGFVAVVGEKIWCTI